MDFYWPRIIISSFNSMANLDFSAISVFIFMGHIFNDTHNYRRNLTHAVVNLTSNLSQLIFKFLGTFCIIIVSLFLAIEIIIGFDYSRTQGNYLSYFVLGLIIISGLASIYLLWKTSVKKNYWYILAIFLFITLLILGMFLV